MTAVTSTTNNSFFKKRYKDEIAENKRMHILNWIMALFGLPLLTVSLLVTIYYEDVIGTYDYDDSTIAMFVVVGVIAMTVSGCIGLSSALFHFRYLYSKSIVDMHYSFPLNNKQRFFADYLAGLTIFLIPIISEVILSIGIMGVASGFMDLTEFWNNFGFVIKAVFMGILGLTFFYTINVFSITLCGRKFEAGFGCIAINVMIPATIACIWFAVMSTVPYGMDDEAIIYNPIFTATSPMGAVVSGIMWVDGYFDSAENKDAVYLRWIISVLIFTAVYLVSAFLIYKNRKAEDVSKPYVTKAYYYAILTMAVFCILSLFIGNDVNPVPGILICAIMWFIMELIERRGFKRFWTAGISFALAVGGVFVIEGICTATKGFGIAYRVPSSISVSSVEIECTDVFPYEVKTSDKDVIKAVIEFQKDVIDRYKNPENYEYELIDDADLKENSYYDEVYFRMTYNLMSGSKMIRVYPFPSYLVSDIAEKLIVTEDYANEVVDGFILHSINDFQIQHGGIWLSNKERALKEGESGLLEVRQNVTEYYPDNYVKSKEELIEIGNALKKDLMNRTTDDIKNHTVYAVMNGIEIWDSYTETKAFLNDMTITEEDAERIVNTAMISRILFEPVFYLRKDGVFTDFKNRFDYDDSNIHYIEHYIEVPSITKFTNNNYRYSSEDSLVCEDYKLLAEFLNYATHVVLNEKPLAVIECSYGDYYIPDTPETRILAEQLKSKISDKNDEKYSYYDDEPEYAYYD